MKSTFTVKNPLGYTLITLMFYLISLLLAFNIRAEESAVQTENQHTIEEGWVEKKIAPSTQWIENLFAPFAQWMESEIQREIHPEQDFPSHNNSHLQLISVQQAIRTVLNQAPGKILRSQFKPGPPPHYKIKMLTEKGMISSYNVHAFNGQLYSPANANPRKEETQP